MHAHMHMCVHTHNTYIQSASFLHLKKDLVCYICVCDTCMCICIYINISSACIYVYHVCAHPQRSEKKIKSPGSGVTNGCKRPCGLHVGARI